MAAIEDKNPKSNIEFLEEPEDENKDNIEFESIEVVPELDENERIGINIVEKQEDTRGRIAQYFIIGFFICIIGVGIAALVIETQDGKSRIDNLREAVLTISGVLSGPLGFIIGYYFRKSEE